VVGARAHRRLYVDQQRRAAALRGGKTTMGSWLTHLTTSRQATPARE